MKYVFVFILILSISIIILDITAHAQTTDCEKWGSESNRNRILCESVKERELADLKMNEILDELIQNLLEEDAKKAVSETQIKWQEYAEKSCYYETVQWLQGRESSIMEETCMLKKINSRTEELQSYLNCNENGCPFLKENKE
jgi:uncharacterized protein YecT (DUF1311 family)